MFVIDNSFKWLYGVDFKRWKTWFCKMCRELILCRSKEDSERKCAMDSKLYVFSLFLYFFNRFVHFVIVSLDHYILSLFWGANYMATYPSLPRIYRFLAIWTLNTHSSFNTNVCAFAGQIDILIKYNVTSIVKSSSFNYLPNNWIIHFRKFSLVTLTLQFGYYKPLRRSKTSLRISLSSNF